MFGRTWVSTSSPSYQHRPPPSWSCPAREIGSSPTSHSSSLPPHRAPMFGRRRDPRSDTSPALTVLHLILSCRTWWRYTIGTRDATPPIPRASSKSGDATPYFASIGQQRRGSIPHWLHGCVVISPRFRSSAKVVCVLCGTPEFYCSASRWWVFSVCACRFRGESFGVPVVRSSDPRAPEGLGKEGLVPRMLRILPWLKCTDIGPSEVLSVVAFPLCFLSGGRTVVAFARVG